MSMSIYRSTYSTTTASSDQTQPIEGQHHHRRHQGSVDGAADGPVKQVDSLELSAEMSDYLAGYVNRTPVSTGTYSAESTELTSEQKLQITMKRMAPPPWMMAGAQQAETENTYADTGLTVEEQRSMLAEIQSRLDALASALAEKNTTAAGAGSPLASLQEELGGLDLSKATDEEIGEAFEEIMGIIAESRPPQPERDRPLPAPADSSGIPSMLRGLGGIAPPFAWGQQSGPASSEPLEGSTGSSPPELTADQKKSILTELTELLQELEPPAEEESAGNDENRTGDHPLPALEEELQSYDASSASDEEISALFDEISQLLQPYLLPPSR
ncbi:hypothetical protein ACP26L_21170 [Paenibacillus sp. S-38]|uniref:hypothetical protein n=1 Tax=Paenibacillus sp. S-38 TaxID=3416710 RepID=UPI003CEB54A0